MLLEFKTGRKGFKIYQYTIQYRRFVNSNKRISFHYQILYQYTCVLFSSIHLNLKQDSIVVSSYGKREFKIE